ncbi:hypothetical protein [Dactylosporangium maewongense]
MNSLVKQFGKDQGLVFVEIIRASPKPIRAQEIKQQLIDAGVKKADVDRHWTRVQRVIKLHPQITMVSTRYEWSTERQPARNSLDVLAGNLLAKLPAWLARALVQNVTDALASAGTADAGWVDQEFEKARLVADLAVAVEVLQTRGDTITGVVKLFTEEARRKRLWPLGQPGETVPFDPGSHDAEAQAPEPGTAVRIARSGYVWRGGGEPIVAAKAIVAV